MSEVPLLMCYRESGPLNVSKRRPQGHQVRFIGTGHMRGPLATHILNVIGLRGCREGSGVKCRCGMSLALSMAVLVYRVGNGS